MDTKLWSKRLTVIDDTRSSSSWISSLWFRLTPDGLCLGVLGLFFFSAFIFWPPVGRAEVMSEGESLANTLVQRSTWRRQGSSAMRAGGLPVEAPDVTITTMEGKQYRLKELCRQNRLVVINFWATWCRPCLEEMPSVERMHLVYRDKRVTFLGIAVTETASRVRTLIDQQKITYEIALDDENKIVRAFGNIRAIPTTVFLDSKNNIVKTYTGCMAKKELEENLKSLLQE